MSDRYLEANVAVNAHLAKAAVGRANSARQARADLKNIGDCYECARASGSKGSQLSAIAGVIEDFGLWDVSK